MKFRVHPQALAANEIAAFIVVFVLVIVGVILSYSHPNFFHDIYVIEDGFIEWLTAIGLFFGFIVCLYRAFILKPFRPKLFRFCLILLSLVYLFGFMEEISYGQRILNYETPQFLVEKNSQGEFNVHNLKFGETKINKLIFGLSLGVFVALYFLVLPVLYRKVEQVKKWADRLALPIPKWFHVGAYIVLFLLVELIPSPKKGEILEFGGVWIFLIMTIRPFNRQLFSRRSLSY